MKTEKQILAKIKKHEKEKSNFMTRSDYYRVIDKDKSDLYFDLYMNEYYKIMMLKWVLK